MADNTLQQENKSIATEDIAGNQVQRMKMVAGDFGTDDGDVSETNPMPVATKNIATETIGPDEVQRVKIAVGNFGVDDGDVSETNPLPNSFLLDGAVASANNPVPVVAERTLIARGQVTNKTHIHIFGSNPDIDPANGENIWANGGLFTFPPAPETFNIVSTSVLDNGVTPNTGARTVLITGLNAAGIETTETLTLNGTTPVVSSVFDNIERVEVITAGSTQANQGSISMVGVTSGLTVANFLPESNSSSLGHYKVPSNKTGYIEKVVLSASKTSGAVGFITFQNRLPGQVFRNIGQIGCSTNGLVYEYTTPPELPSGTELKFFAEVLSNNTHVTIFMELVLIDN